MRHFVAVIAVLLATVAVGQNSDGFVPDPIQPAPTVEQCRADGKLWLWQFEHKSNSNLTFRELNSQAVEMVKCKAVEFNPLYAMVLDWVELRLGERLENYLTRNGLWQQFLAEDESGMR